MPCKAGGVGKPNRRTATARRYFQPNWVDTRFDDLAAAKQAWTEADINVRHNVGAA